MTDIVAKAIEIASSYHVDQIDKAGYPYILHPLAVMNIARSKFGYNPNIMAAAVLHDTIEDTTYTDVQLYEDFPVMVADTVMLLTKADNEKYEDYMKRVLSSKSAMMIKICDLTHNLDPSRMISTTPKDEARTTKYMKSYEKIKQKLLTNHGVVV